jgi:ABC-type uncharacterized transport system auxiliary subunit
MNKRIKKLFVNSIVVLMSIVLSGCGTGSSPTEPQGDYTLVVVGSVTHTSYQYTMRRVQLRVDDKVIRDFSSNSSFYDITLSGTQTASKGSHRVEVRVMEQSSSPNSYRVSATVNVLDSAGREVTVFNFPEKTVTLSNGQGVTYTFSI